MSLNYINPFNLLNLIISKCKNLLLAGYFDSIAYATNTTKDVSMRAIIIFGHGKEGAVAEDSKIMNLGLQVTYREEGIFSGDGEIGSPYLNFNPFYHASDRILIVSNGDMPTEQQIQEAFHKARLSHPWNLTLQ